jgi:hypothetical protein
MTDGNRLLFKKNKEEKLTLFLAARMFRNIGVKLSMIFYRYDRGRNKE